MSALIPSTRPPPGTPPTALHTRPSYPPAALDAIEELAGRPWRAQVADIGAGTGIATALLRERGAHVVAVEPGDGMAAGFRRALPGVPIVRGDGNALPLADASHDLVTYAQSWHWTDTRRSVPEALRVLRPGGSLAVWRNIDVFDVPWIAEQHERIARHCGVPPTFRSRPDDLRAARLSGLSGLAPERRHVCWSRVVPLDTQLADIGSHSAFLVLGEAGARAFLEEERTRLRKVFPDERVEECYLVDLLVVARP
ncbi:class I SAM-dependent methyltransferase [Streptomyces sp. NPDC048248]|uniref:class I SAM-dependent methyltransferase n=1 Tax=Streptomyces sp. NPDC048248 TaxID=3365523 RepID=UPI003722F87B